VARWQSSVKLIDTSVKKQHAASGGLFFQSNHEIGDSRWPDIATLVFVPTTTSFRPVDGCARVLPVCGHFKQRLGDPGVSF
jgi:hypothetical protein